MVQQKRARIWAQRGDWTLRERVAALASGGRLMTTVGRVREPKKVTHLASRCAIRAGLSRGLRQSLAEACCQGDSKCSEGKVNGTNLWSTRRFSGELSIVRCFGSLRQKAWARLGLDESH